VLTGNLYLILGCFGRKDGDFVSCPSCENKILKIDSKIEHYNEMMDYFETCRLFDKPMFEYNAIAHFIKNMRDRFDQVNKRLWSEATYHIFQNFFHTHRTCGLYIKLILINDEETLLNEKHDEKGIFIKAIDNQKKHPPKLNLRLLRGKR